MTVPRSLTLRKTDRGYRLFSQPVEELQALRTASHSLPHATISGSLDLTDRFEVGAGRVE